ncbi:tRNA uridine 5-carboxymethylaminomethyl modification enzyme MnmG [Phytophthora cinnamomi]|uniref:tRNA uridine 5-carboxymethylaminomethyl modification enzyme MnmG n=1 Tax=Phytophthora cinnamomi TaxID=4785 RepID=UPI00355A08C0|nr:tRNA uridine 5-carboxymethylaminomethyl modification enzyme MnmG [Phytophthora cinnamomi]
MKKELAPLSTGPKSIASSSHPRQRNVGVLEVKMKHRLQEDLNAVAVGILCKTGKHQGGQHHHSKKPQRLPKLSKSEPTLNTRPISFETEREQVMSDLQLPSPTRSVIDRHVQVTKHSTQLAQEALPPVAGAFKKRSAPASLFPQAYARNELPIMIEGGKGGGKAGLRWTAPMEDLDFSKYFPLFVDGMREKAFPFSFLAREGAFQLAAFAQRHPNKLVDCLHRVIPALRTNLETRDNGALRDALLLLQQLAQTPGVGPLLVPYYRQVLPILNMFKSKRRNLGDEIDFRQQRLQDLGEVIMETLELLEQTGGEDAFINIKYMVPTYESALS